MENLFAFKKWRMRDFHLVYSYLKSESIPLALEDAKGASDGTVAQKNWFKTNARYNEHCKKTHVVSPPNPSGNYLLKASQELSKAQGSQNKVFLCCSKKWYDINKKLMQELQSILWRNLFPYHLTELKQSMFWFSSSQSLENAFNKSAAIATVIDTLFYIHPSGCLPVLKNY